MVFLWPLVLRVKLMVFQVVSLWPLNLHVVSLWPLVPRVRLMVLHVISL